MDVMVEVVVVGNGGGSGGRGACAAGDSARLMQVHVVRDGAAVARAPDHPSLLHALVRRWEDRPERLEVDVVVHLELRVPAQRAVVVGAAVLLAVRRPLLDRHAGERRVDPLRVQLEVELDGALDRVDLLHVVDEEAARDDARRADAALRRQQLRRALVVVGRRAGALLAHRRALARALRDLLHRGGAHRYEQLVVRPQVRAVLDLDALPRVQHDLVLLQRLERRAAQLVLEEPEHHRDPRREVVVAALVDEEARLVRRALHVAAGRERDAERRRRAGVLGEGGVHRCGERGKCCRVYALDAR